MNTKRVLTAVVMALVAVLIGLTIGSGMKFLERKCGPLDGGWRAGVASVCVVSLGYVTLDVYHALRSPERNFGFSLFDPFTIFCMLTIVIPVFFKAPKAAA